MGDRAIELEQRLLSMLVEGLPRLDEEARLRVIRVAAAYCNVSLSTSGGGRSSQAVYDRNISESLAATQADREPVFGGRDLLSAKAFILDKSPQTDIERATCLAYYLAQYRNQSHFKTVDITKINTEAAQVRFANAADTVENATKRGFFAPAGKGMKQITALGERYVDALPDRGAAREVMDRFKPRRTAR
ncbi:MAG: hypothetical protein U0637_01875 [Phycisphaerales bacterium]